MNRMTGWQDNKRIALEGCGGYLKIHCGTVMVVVQETAAVHRLGCRGSVGPSHRK